MIPLMNTFIGKYPVAQLIFGFLVGDLLGQVKTDEVREFWTYEAAACGLMFLLMVVYYIKAYFDISQNRYKR